MIRKTFVAIFALSVSLGATQAGSTIDDVNASGYGANIGFISWKPSAGDGVSIGEFICSGFIYAANGGWISMGNGSPTNHIQ